MEPQPLQGSVQSELQQWFEERLVALPTVKIRSVELMLVGLDALRGRHRRLVAEAFRVWHDQHNQVLTEGELCLAFFQAAQSCSKLQLPDFNKEQRTR